MASDSKGEVLQCKVDPCAKCGKKVKENCAQNVVNGCMLDARK